MKLILNTDIASNSARKHYMLDGMVDSNVIFHSSGEVASVKIKGDIILKGMPYFNNLRCLVLEAMQ